MCTNPLIALGTHLRSLLRDRSGNFAILTALLMVPLMGALGLAVDYARVSHARYVLLGAADAAVAAAISKGSRTHRNGLAFTADWTQRDAERDMLNMFEVNIVDNVGFTISKTEAKVLAGGDRISAAMSFEVQVPLIFMRAFFGRNDFVIRGSAKALVGGNPYIDFYLVLDNSPSMGLGATQADIDLMIQKMPDKCAFACHSTNNRPNNTFPIAQALGVKLRIDVVRLAAENLFDKAVAMTNAMGIDPMKQDQYRMASYTFGESAGAVRLTEVGVLSGNLADGQNKVKNKVALMYMTGPSQHDSADTPLPEILFDLNKKVPRAGSGSGKEDRQKIVLFVSDGVADYPAVNCSRRVINKYNRCIEPINPKDCRPLKARGVKVAVLYTTYIPIDDDLYHSDVAPYQPSISTRMKECATDGLFFEVSPSQGIVEAMEALFKKAIASPPRITG